MEGKAKHIASISLAVMGTGFFATLPFQNTGWGRVLQAGFEAGLVGGLADWFAVTALFRHPLGIPIPHTALLPKNREKVIQALIHTLENDWLNKESIEKEITSLDLSGYVLDFAIKEISSPTFQHTLTSISKEVLEVFDVKAIAVPVAKEVKGFLRDLDLSPFLPKLTDELIRREYDGLALNYLMEKASDWVIRRENRNRLGKMALELLDRVEVDGFMGFALRSFTSLADEKKVGKMIQDLLLNVTGQLRNPENPLRNEILSSLRSRINTLSREPGFLGELQRLKDGAVEGWNAEEQLIPLLEKGKAKLIEFLSSPVAFENHIHPLMLNMLTQWKESEEKRQRLEKWLQQQIFRIVEENHEKIGQLVKKNLDKLDNETLIAMMEDKIGKDLQWIRVNGALTGFLIGLGLVLIKMIIL